MSQTAFFRQEAERLIQPKLRERFFRFPENRKAKANTVEQQAEKVLEEARECFDAVFDMESDERIIEECLDTVNACEGLLRKFPLWKVLVYVARVKIKCLMRGDYE